MVPCRRIPAAWCRMTTPAPDAHPGDALDLLTVDAAAELVERDPSTVRRWVRSGRLTRHDGAPGPGGGMPPILVDRAELEALAGGPSRKPTPESPPGDGEAAAAARTAARKARRSAERAAAELAEVRSRLEATEAERARLAGLVESLRAELAQAHQDVAVAEVRLAERTDRTAELRADLDRERTAREQEAAAARSAAVALAALAADVDRYASLPWFARMLAAPPSPRALPGPVGLVVEGEA